METKNLIETLHPLERKVLPILEQKTKFSDIVMETGLQDVEVMRALQWLQNKDIINIKDSYKELVDLGKIGNVYRKVGLPEKRFLIAIKDKPQNAEHIIESADITKEELNACIGVLKSKLAINIEKGGELIVSITENGKRLIEKSFIEDEFLKKDFPLETKELTEEENSTLDRLSKRKDIVKVVVVREKTPILTKLGKELLKTGIEIEDIIDNLDTQILKTGVWKGKRFRRFDIKINVPKIFGGRKQHYRAFLDEVRKKFLALGFTEMFGPIVESDFWDMDSLYMPQFHSARDIHDAYYVREPKYMKLDSALIKKVKSAHENGFNTGSKGWQYNFDSTLTKRLLLRTQGTACSSRMLASKELKIPGKYFAIARCFRYDVVDATHNCDFYQTEGIVVEEGIDFRHLKALLRLFAREFAGTDEIKITPAYFPFTEPSAELHAKHPQLGWIELGGCGILRPEVVKPLLEKEISVLAWGIGIDRIAMFKLGLNDIRQLFSHDLQFLRNVKA